MKTNTLTWIFLVLLTSTGALARSVFSARAAAMVILGAAGIKCAALSWQYMDLRSAHGVWRAALLSLTVIVFAGVWYLSNRR